MNANDRFYPVVQTPVGKVLLIGATITVERERELCPGGARRGHRGPDS